VLFHGDIKAPGNRGWHTTTPARMWPTGMRRNRYLLTI
jgi:hypothetical protein